MDQPIETQEEARISQANKLFQTGVLLIYGKRKSIDKAIKCIQRAITLNNANYKYWQLLGEAYYQRGSLGNAINSFINSLKLAEVDDSSVEDTDKEKQRHADCTYSRMRMSDIRLSVGHLEEAALGYSNIIEADSTNLAALLGMSKTELQQARNSFSSGLVNSGHSHCMKALRFALKAIKIAPQLCITWKLASDCCLIQFVYGQRGDFKTTIDEQFPGGEDGTITIDRIACIELAQQFLCKALDIEPFQESACLWHNLGISLYLKSTLIRDCKVKECILRRSIRCLLKALDCDRGNSQMRNSIGVVAMSLNLLNSAQNFLIKSIQMNMSTSEMQFSNLGYLYLQKGEYRLASVAFSRCQAEEPLYSRSWLGNALVSEQNNQDNLSSLRHCHRLENNYESQLMYATKVTSLADLDEYKKDIINALDCMSRLINYNQDSLEANVTLGLLYERCNCHHQAASCFKRASNISSQDSRVVFNSLRLHKVPHSCYSDNLVSPSDTDLIKKAEKMVNGGNKEHILNYIYYLFRNEDYREVNSKMTKFMDKLPQTDIRNKIGAQILLALASKAEGNDFKSWLFKNIIDSENITCIESVINLNCLMLLGAIEKETDLVGQTSKDLGRHLLAILTASNVQFSQFFHSIDGLWIRLTIFCSIFCLKDQSKLIRPLVALFPTEAELWLYLGLTLMFEKSKHSAAIYCIKRAELMGSTFADLSAICYILLAILSQVVKARQSNLDTRIKYLSRAIHTHPDEPLLWTSMLDSQLKDNSRRNELFGEENAGLFQLAIDHIIRMILSCKELPFRQ